jgi:hypothetical protein
VVSVHGDSNQHFPNGVTGSTTLEFDEYAELAEGFAIKSSEIEAILVDVEEVVPVEREPITITLVSSVDIEKPIESEGTGVLMTAVDDIKDHAIAD